MQLLVKPDSFHREVLKSHFLDVFCLFVVKNEQQCPQINLFQSSTSTCPTEVQGTSRCVLWHTEYSVHAQGSQRRFPPPQQLHLHYTERPDDRGRDEMSLGNKKLYETMVSFLFKKNVLRKHLWPLLEINAEFLSLVCITQKGMERITKPSANIFSDHLYHLCWGWQWYSLLLPST